MLEMLVISRKLGESIVINGNIHITVLKLGTGRVRLGLSAPQTVRIHRSEELSPVLEKPDDIESLGGSTFVDSLTLFAHPPNQSQSQDLVGARKAFTVEKLDFPGLEGSDHGARDSDCACQ
jgi:carbon storage regulator